MYSLIIFDWDGTLVDSVARIVASIRLAIEDVGLPALADDRLKDIIGLGLPEAMRALYPQVPTMTHDRLRERYAHYFVQSGNIPVHAFPGVEAALHKLSDQGLTLAVATGKSRKGLNRAMQDTGWTKYFAHSRCADETLSKPHPKMLEELLEEAAVQPEHALMIGDTEYDLEMAQRAGVDRVAVSYGVHELDRLQRFQPNLVIDHIDELLDWLASRLRVTANYSNA